MTLDVRQSPRSVAVERLREAVRDTPDFPTPGILFRDIAPVLRDAELFAAAVELLAAPFDAQPPTHLVAVESRGFLFGVPLALRWGAGLVPVRKAGKLPGRTTREEYALEYGRAVLEMQVDALAAGDRVIVVDDVIATGGTAAAASRLVERLGATVVGYTFLLALDALGGAERLRSKAPVHVVLRYE